MWRVTMVAGALILIPCITPIPVYALDKPLGIGLTHRDRQEGGREDPAEGTLEPAILGHRKEEWLGGGWVEWAHLSRSD